MSNPVTTTAQPGPVPVTTSATASNSTYPQAFTVGTLIGAVIGAAAGASLVTFLVAFFFYRRSRQRGHHRVATPDSSLSHRSWEYLLPQAADDNTICRAVETLFNQIDLHVENYYCNDAPTSISNSSREALQTLDPGLWLRPLATMLLENSSPLPLIKHCFAWTILTNITPSENVENSLLPLEFARSPAILVMKKELKSREERDLLRAYSYWRVLTAHLMYPSWRNQGDIANSLRHSTASAMASALLTAFTPWLRDVRESEAALVHLHSILKTAMETGLLYMSQPSSFRFDWSTNGGEHASAEYDDGHRGILVRPAFDKTVDDRGHVLKPRQVMVERRYESAQL